MNEFKNLQGYGIKDEYARTEIEKLKEGVPVVDVEAREQFQTFYNEEFLKLKGAFQALEDKVNGEA